ncbi:MAG: aminopeptidase P family protein [Saprospiraceae bacterium]
MFAPNIYAQRRQQLIENIDSGLILLLGNELSPMNCEDNTYAFRQDSSFLYYAGIDLHHLAIIIDVDQGDTTLFGVDLTVEGVVWTGPQPTMREYADRSGIELSADYGQLSKVLQKANAQGRKVHFLPPYRPENKILLHQLLNIPINNLQESVSVELIKAIVAQRSVKSNEEIIEMEKAVNITADMHVAAMRAARLGIKEAELAGMVEGMAISSGGQLAYPVILTVNGQTLHNHYHGNTLTSGKMVLGDFGASSSMHYAGDITRTFPVDKKFTQQQREIYNIVLAAENEVIDALKPGVSYYEMHEKSATIITEGLKELGLMRGNTQEAVRAGAHALFFPHGLGHMIGLDVHDMEDIGEDYVGYDKTIQRNPLFGFKSLRLGRKLEPGFVITVEPGIYFIPELITMWESENKHANFINYPALGQYLDFGGIRIEDNVMITQDSHRVLGTPIPKTITEVENIRAGS